MSRDSCLTAALSEERRLGTGLQKLLGLGNYETPLPHRHRPRVGRVLQWVWVRSASGRPSGQRKKSGLSSPSLH